MKTLRNIFLYAVAAAAVVFFWSLFTVASQSSDPTGLYHSSFTDWPSLAVDHVKKSPGVSLRWGMLLFIVLPIITKTIQYFRGGHKSSSDAHTTVNDAGPRVETAWEQLNHTRAKRLADPAPVEHRRVS